jgi:hypothetical protein
MADTPLPVDFEKAGKELDLKPIRKAVKDLIDFMMTNLTFRPTPRNWTLTQFKDTWIIG